MSFYDDASLVFLPSGGAGKDGKAYSIKPVPEYGSELVTNGGFNTDSDWVKETGWTISGGTANCDGTQTSTSQLRTSVGLSIQNTLVEFSFEVKNYSAGTLTATIEGTGGNEFSGINSNGVYTIQATSSDLNPKIVFNADSSFIGSIDNVSVKEVIVGDADFTFSRGGDPTATRVDSNGLIEKGRENLLLQSNQFDTTWSGNASVTSGQSGYDGSSNAWLLEKDNTGSFILISQNLSPSGVWTFSVYAKANSLDSLTLRNQTNGHSATFDLTNATISTNNTIDSSIVSVGNDWYRCTATFSGSSSQVAIYVGFGDSSAGSVYIQDAQIEQGLVATEYIESGATTGKAGLLENEPRFDYSGGASCPSLLLEPSRTNLVTQSEYFGGYSNSNSTDEPNATTSPEGLTNATAFLEAATTAQHKLVTSFGFDGTSTYTFSIFAKHNGRDLFIDTQNSNEWGGRAWFDLTAGTANAVLGTANIEDYGNGWYRCIVTGASTLAGGNSIELLTSDGSTNSTTGDITKGVYIYGAQLEQGSYPTSYIPNHSGGSVMRLGEGQSSSDFSAELSTPLSNAYTLFLDFEVTNNEDTSLNFQDIFNFKFDESLSKDGVKIETYHVGGVDSIRVFVYKQSSGTQVTSVAPNVIPMGSRVKLACVLDDSYGVKIFYNGTKIIDHQEITAYEQIKFLKGSGVNGNIRSKTLLNKILAFPTTLSEGECISLTTL